MNIQSEEYMELLTDYVLPDAEAISQYRAANGFPTGEDDYCYAAIDGRYGVIYLKREGMPELNLVNYTYGAIPKLYGLMQDQFDTTSLVNSGILQTQRPPLSLTGRGVVIAFIDSGIRYQEDVFRDAAGNSRILAIWDQTDQNGTSPEGFSYGSEYTREDINRALQSDDPLSVVPVTDPIGHGTNMAAVAAGSNLNNGIDYLGAAPDCDIVMVKCKPAKQYLRDYYLLADDAVAFAESDIMLALEYVESFVIQAKRPVVICLGIGTNMGDHAGNSLLDGYLDSIAIRRSRGIVVCGGTEGNTAHHFQGTVRNLGNGRGAVSAEIRVTEGNPGFTMEFWGNAPNLFLVDIRSPGGEMLNNIGGGLGKSVQYSFLYDKTVIQADSVLVERNSGNELIFFKFISPTPGIWTIRVYSVREVFNGVFHMWLLINEFLENSTYFLEPTAYVTLTEPGMADEVLTVSTYSAYNNSFYAESGRGFSRTDRIKPEIAAPGVDISTPFGVSSGSSLAAAMTAGAVAQFMQWAEIEENQPLVESREIKSIMIRRAVRDSGSNYPSREWGYGRLRVTGAFDAIAGF